MQTLLTTLSLCIVSCFLIAGDAQPVNWLPYNNSLADATSSKIFIAYPRAKEDKKFFIFLNTRNIGNIDYGERMIYTISAAGMLKVTISTEKDYKEPATLSRTSRMINIDPGKEYYFEINSKGELEYMVNPEKGKPRFLNENSFSGAPQTFSENLYDTPAQP